MRDGEQRAARAASPRNAAAAPPVNRSCGGPPWRNTSMSFHSTPRECPVPSAFIAASLAANRPARLGTGIALPRTIGNLAVGEDAAQEAVAVPLEHLAHARDVGRVEPETDDAHVRSPAYRRLRRGRKSPGAARCAARGWPRRTSSPRATSTLRRRRARVGGGGRVDGRDRAIGCGSSSRSTGSTRPSRAALDRARQARAVPTRPRPTSSSPTIRRRDRRARRRLRAGPAARSRRRDVVGAAHAGWRGTAARRGRRGGARDAGRSSASRPPTWSPRSGRAWELLRRSRPGCRRGVPRRRRGPRVASPPGFTRAPAIGRCLDLERANRDQLERAGVNPDAIFGSGLCTKTHRARLHSYRADRNAAGRMLGAHPRLAR